MRGPDRQWHREAMGNPSGADGRMADPAYALARCDEEYDRLSRQAAFLRGTTERLFRVAGLAPGMRVLDVGSGAGDVALLAAELVGAGARSSGSTSTGRHCGSRVGVRSRSGCVR